MELKCSNLLLFAILVGLLFQLHSLPQWQRAASGPFAESKTSFRFSHLLRTRQDVYLTLWFWKQILTICLPGNSICDTRGDWVQQTESSQLAHAKVQELSTCAQQRAGLLFIVSTCFLLTAIQLISRGTASMPLCYFLIANARLDCKMQVTVKRYSTNG